MEARAVIEKIHASRENGVKRGLENTARLMKALNIHPGVPVIHVAGTNGKGSTCAMLESALRPYRTGLFTSPFLQQYAERIRIDGRPATDEMISSCGSEVLRCAEALNREGVYPTPFELGTALAALIFQREQVGVWILETGMGGRNDPTTAIPADLSGITSIGLDHRQYLGDTIEDIAREKAGIMCRQKTCVAADGPGRNILESEAERIGAHLICPPGTVLSVQADPYGVQAEIACGEKYQLSIPLPGLHQVSNALVAVRLLEEVRTLGIPVSREEIIRGLSSIRWPGRLEWHGNLLIDGAHNPPAVHALGRYVHEFLKCRPVLLTSVMADKDTQALAEEFSAFVSDAVTVNLPEVRAMKDTAWADILQQHGIHAQAGGSVQDGLDMALRLADGRPVLVAGSFYLAGAVRSAAGLEP